MFEALDKLEDILGKNRYLLGDSLTEADVRLFTTLVRFDLVYFGKEPFFAATFSTFLLILCDMKVHFKCNKKMIQDYENLSNYMREIYQMEPVHQTFSQQQMDHAKKHYYLSHGSINPHRIVPIGGPTEKDYLKPHNRAERFKK